MYPTTRGCIVLQCGIVPLNNGKIIELQNEVAEPKSWDKTDRQSLKRSTEESTEYGRVFLTNALPPYLLTRLLSRVCKTECWAVTSCWKSGVQVESLDGTESILTPCVARNISMYSFTRTSHEDLESTAAWQVDTVICTIWHARPQCAPRNWKALGVNIATPLHHTTPISILKCVNIP